MNIYKTIGTFYAIILKYAIVIHFDVNMHKYVKHIQKYAFTRPW